jgi:hypothetical protein
MTQLNGPSEEEAHEASFLFYSCRDLHFFISRRIKRAIIHNF